MTSIENHFDLFLIVLQYAEFSEIQKLFTYAVENSNHRLSEYLLQTNKSLTFEISPKLMKVIVQNQMFKLLHLLFSQTNVSLIKFFNFVATENRYDVKSVKSCIVSAHEKYDLSWLRDVTTTNKEMKLFFNIATSNYNDVSELCDNVMLVNMFFTDAPIQCVSVAITNNKSLKYDMWHAVVGILRRNDDNEIISLLESVEKNSNLFENPLVFNNTIAVVLSDCDFLSHYILVKWMISQKMTPPYHYVPLLAAFGDQDLFIQACLIVSNGRFDSEYSEVEDVLVNGIRSENWDFVRFLAKKYGYNLMTKALWYAVACDHTNLLQICFDENLADVKSCFEHSCSESQTYQFLCFLFPGEKTQNIKKRKLQ